MKKTLNFGGFLSLGRSGVWTQGFTLAGQALLALEPNTQSFFALVCFFK
jgi:hypothetical protein